MKKKVDLIIYIFILLTPFIDFFTGICSWHNIFSIGIIIRGIFLIYVLYYLIFKVHDKYIYYILGLLSLYLLFFLMVHKYSLMTNITYLMRVFYLPLLLCFFKNYKSDYLTKKVYVYLLCFYVVLYIVPFLFSMGHNIREIYPNKDLYLSYFYVGNELVNVFLLLFIINISYFIKWKSKFIIALLIMSLFVIYLLGTKVMYIGLLITLIYFMFVYRKDIFSYLSSHVYIYSIVIIIMGLIFFLGTKTSFYKNIKTTLEYYNVSNIKEMVSYEKINQVIFSNRLSFLENAHSIYSNSNVSNKLFGIGREILLENKDVEIDIFDIYYDLGFIGFIVYILLMGYSLKAVKWDRDILFGFTLIVFVSFFSGHVLASPMVSSILSMSIYFKGEE